MAFLLSRSGADARSLPLSRPIVATADGSGGTALASRRHVLLAGLGIAASLAGCGGGDAVEYRSATLRNTGTSDLRFGLAINGETLFSSDADILAAVSAEMARDTAAAPPHPSRNFALALWRFLYRSRYNHDPLTAWTWAHAPVLFVNSLGFGLCDDVASAYVALARAAGYEARVWTLSGHVVPEIRIDGRWEMYDPDLGVYYLDAQGLPCGVDVLAAEPSLISNPRIATPPPWATEVIALGGQVPPGDVRYSQYLADIYAASSNNLVSLWYDEIPYTPPSGLPVLLPAGASIAIGRRDEPSVVAFYGQLLERQGALQLTLPAAKTGVIDMPLIPLRIEGTGTVRLNGIDYTVGSEALRLRLSGFESAVAAIEVLQSATSLMIEYLLSDTRFRLETVDSVIAGSAAGAALVVSYSEHALA